jgi:hypothetical protein
MKSASAAGGALSGCTVWLVLVAVLAMCMVPVACVFTLFTGTSDLAAGIVGPMVCPANSRAQIETSTETFVDENGVPLSAAAREMVCVDDDGAVVARPAPLPNWIWTGLVSAAALILAGLLALLLAAPAGVLVGGLLGRMKK